MNIYMSNKNIASADWLFRDQSQIIALVVQLSVLQEKNQVGDGGGQKRGDQPTIHLIVNFFGKKSSKDYREESTSWHNCMSSQGVDVTIKDLEADLKTMKIIVN